MSYAQARTARGRGAPAQAEVDRILGPSYSKISLARPGFFNWVLFYSTGTELVLREVQVL